MVITIQDGRTEFYQWDLNRKLVLTDIAVGVPIHFIHNGATLSVLSVADGEDVVVNVPNVCLQSSGSLELFVYPDSYTKVYKTFRVVGRPQPSDYAYTDTDVKHWEELEQRIEALEEGGTGDSCPITLVESYPNENVPAVAIRSLESGTYILKGRFVPFEGSSMTFSFSTGMLVSVVTNTNISYAQIFFSKGNTIQYLEITDDSYTRKDAKLANAVSWTEMSSEINSASDESHFPSSKAVYDFVTAYVAEQLA